MTDLKISKEGGQTGGAAESTADTSTFLRKDGVYAQPLRADGVVALNAGTDSAGSAPILTALGAATTVATQLADLTRDYMVYLEVTTAGTATSVKIGHTSSANDVTIMASAAATAGQVISFRLPAGWWFLWAGTTTAIANQVAVGC
jgi:hypothetical protein